MNKVIIIGHLGADPEVRNTQGGSRVARLSVATTRKWKDGGGKLCEETTWHRVTVWGALADFALTYCPKGRQVCVEGRLHNSSYDKDGVKHYSTEIVGDRLQGLGPSPTPNNNRGQQQQPAAGNWEPPAGYAGDDNVPF